MQKSKEKTAYLEYIRIIAIVLVLYCHSGNNCLLSYITAPNEIMRSCSVFMASICECCIYLFFFISGAVLLKKQESLKTILIHRLMPMLITTVAVVFIQYAYNILKIKGVFSFNEFLNALFSGGAITTQWFLYAYLAFLLILPFTQRLAGAMENSSLYWYLIILFIVIKIFAPMLQTVTDWDAFGLTLPILEYSVGAPLVGYFLHNMPAKALYSRKGKWATAAVAFIIAIFNTFINMHSLKVGQTLAYSTLFIFVYAVAVFILLHSDKKLKADSLLLSVSGSVFGIYLFEPQIKDLIYLCLRNTGLRSSSFLYGVTEIVLCIIAGTLIINICKGLLYIIKQVLERK